MIQKESKGRRERGGMERRGVEDKQGRNELARGKKYGKKGKQEGGGRYRGELRAD